jgi:PAS domain
MSLSFLDRFRPQLRNPATPGFDGLAQVRAYWEGLCQAGAPPTRDQLDPRGLSGVLDRVFLAERIGPGLAQVRMAGSGLSGFAGLDLRGLPLSCLFAPDARPLLGQALERVFADAAIVDLDLGADRSAPGTIVAQLLLLPLQDRAGGGLVLGAMGFASGRKVQGKFQLLARREDRLARQGQPDQAAPAPAAVVTPIRQFGHLALVHSST